MEVLYEKRGSANVFGFLEPKTGQRHLRVTERRTKQDFAHAIDYLLTELYPAATKVRLVLDNLNTHTLAALYDTFPAEEARRLARRLEFHFTPKHGSWLNVQELEWSALDRQALGERIGDRARLERLVAHWLEERRKRTVTINWQFTTADARIKLKRLYPQMIG